MKAITLTKNGGVENLLIKEIEKPVITSTEVLVQVKAIGIDPVDAFVRHNEQAMKAFLQPQPGKEIIIGWSISGFVTATGSDVKGIKVGDAVFGMVNFPGSGNAYAEYVAAPADQLALKPGNISHEEAAAATLAALTAWGALVTYGKIKKGDKVLIHAAAGGVGHFAVQIARHFGAYVIGTASTPNREFVLGLGAHEFLDYTKEKFEEKIKDADLVLDCLPGDHLARSLEAVKKGGRLISLLTFFDKDLLELAKQKEVLTHRFGVVSNGEDMKIIAGLLEKGQLHPHIAHTYRFEEMPLAHQQVETGKTRGKIVVIP